MRTILILSLCLLAASQQYNLVWQDEFNGNALDTTKWQYEINCDGGGNSELQCYTNSAQNLAVTGGNLVITARPQNLNGKQYTSARINTAASTAWKYGKFEIRAKLPNGPYLWPALWMMPRDSVYGGWAASGEIDIVEARGQSPNLVESTLHHGGSWPNNIYTGSGPTDMGVDLSADFHVYTAIWTSSQIQFAVDGNVYHTLSLDRSWWSGRGSNPYTTNGQPFDQYFYFIINLAVGGGFFGNQANSLTVQQAQQWQQASFLVDYVRVYQLSQNAVTPPAPVPLPVPTTSSTIASTTPAVTSSLGSGGCPAGMCGNTPCCNDQTNGPTCYSETQYTCSMDGYSNRYGLCGAGYYLCRGACYHPQQYSCVNGNLQPVAQSPTPSTTPQTSSSSSTAAPAVPSSSTTPKSSTSSTSATRAATSSTTRAATSSTNPKSTSPASTARTTIRTTTLSTTKIGTTTTGAGKTCTGGCGRNACCNGKCYEAATYSCEVDPLGTFQVCPIGTKACATGCYDPAIYTCGPRGLQR